jgi:hypothetical protein
VTNIESTTLQEDIATGQYPRRFYRALARPAR